MKVQLHELKSNSPQYSFLYIKLVFTSDLFDLSFFALQYIAALKVVMSAMDSLHIENDTAF